MSKNELPSRFYRLKEVAALVGVDLRTIQRDVADGFLIANYIRGAPRISDHSLLAYIRKTRSNTRTSRRRKTKRCQKIKNPPAGVEI